MSGLTPARCERPIIQHAPLQRSLPMHTSFEGSVKWVKFKEGTNFLNLCSLNYLTSMAQIFLFQAALKIDAWKKGAPIG